MPLAGREVQRRFVVCVFVCSYYFYSIDNMGIISMYRIPSKPNTFALMCCINLEQIVLKTLSHSAKRSTLNYQCDK